MFGDHQVEFDAQGNPRKDANTNWDKPVEYNHAAVSGAYRTTMGSSGPTLGTDSYSKDGKKVSNGSNAYDQFKI